MRSGPSEQLRPMLIGLHVLHRVPQRLDRLRGDHRLAAAADGRRDHDRQLLAVRVEHLADRDQRRLGVQRIEDRLDQQHVAAARDQRADLLGVGRLHLVEGDDAEAGVVGVGRIRQRDRERTDAAGDEALPAVGVADAIGPLAALAGGLLVDLPGQALQERVLDDLLVEGRVLAAAVLARIVDEELALGDAGRAEGVGLDDVGAGLEEAPVDVADHLRLRQREQVAVVQQVLAARP